MTQEELRDLLKERTQKEKQIYIANVTGIDKDVLSRFKLGKTIYIRHYLQSWKTISQIHKIQFKYISGESHNLIISIKNSMRKNLWNWILVTESNMRDLFIAVVAVIYTTIYLRAVKDDSTDYAYEINEVYKTYRDIEFLGKR